jgi:hypothetical protein
MTPPLSIFSSEDLEIILGQLRYLDCIDDESWFEHQISQIDNQISKLTSHKNKLFEDRSSSPNRRDYLNDRYVYIENEMEKSRLARAKIAEEKRARSTASTPREKRVSIPLALRKLLEEKKLSIDPKLWKELGIS